jgi:hypothetical protein
LTVTLRFFTAIRRAAASSWPRHGPAHAGETRIVAVERYHSQPHPMPSAAYQASETRGPRVSVSPKSRLKNIPMTLTSGSIIDVAHALHIFTVFHFLKRRQIRNVDRPGDGPEAARPRRR